MAHFIPSLNHIECLPDHSGELDTLQQLTGLSNQYTVFHGVHWMDEARQGLRFGEIDFIVLHQSGQILVVEQKNGALEESGSTLVKRYPDGREKDVVSQVGRSVDAIRQHFAKLRLGSGLLIDYLIYCPDFRLRRADGLEVVKSRVVDASRRDQICAVIDSLMAGADSNPDLHRRLTAAFKQTYRIQPDVGAFISRSRSDYVRLSGGLLESIRSLSFSPFRLRVQGVAGCGKTQASLVYLNEASDQKRTLYVCFNRPLFESMKSLCPDLGPHAHLNTFHGLCAHALDSQDQLPAVPSGERPGPAYFQSLIDRVIEFGVPDSMRFDMLIVDEGQDFEEEWWEVLSMFLADGYHMVWFEDPAQNLSQKPPVMTDASVTLRASRSYRTPPSIAAFISRAHGIEFNSSVTSPGLGVEVHSYSDPEEQVALVNKAVKELRHQGFDVADIAVLTCGGWEKSALSGVGKINGYKVRRYTGRFVDGHAEFTDGELQFESVYRFKGGQAAAVVLVDVSPTDSRVSAGLPVVLCGMTRATVKLVMLVDQANPNTQRYREAQVKVFG